MSHERPASAIQTVLIVDDDPETRSLLGAYAREQGLATDEAENGVSALARARQAPPDLILLDIDMPVMNGREALTWLKEDHRLRGIPVVVISGVSETAVAVQCIEAGAEDYLTKPVELTLLRARMRSSLDRARLRVMEAAYQRQMEAYGVDLEQRVRAKTRQLAEANERLRILDRAKDEFLRLISHELRTPMTGVVGASDALTEGELDPDTRSAAAQLLRDSVARLSRIVEDALLVTSIKVSDGFVLEARGLRRIAEVAATRASPPAVREGIRIELSVEHDCRVLCDERLLTEALAALLECAVKFSAPQRVVRLEAARTDQGLRLLIRATGRSIPAALVPRFFEIFSLSAEPLTPGGDLGLGPAVAAQILRLLGGSVEVESGENGVSFAVLLRSAGLAEPPASKPPDPGGGAA